MATQTPEVTETPKVVDPSVFFGWNVIVLNDDYNTFEHVAETLARVIPDVTLEKGWELAEVIHTNGHALVWSGVKELAQAYHSRLSAAGLTMAPLFKS